MDRVWRRIVRNHKKWNGKNARIVYLTHRSLQEDVSIILEAKNMDSVAEFVTKHITPMKEVAAVRIIGLMKPRFFKMPKKRIQEPKRYTVSVTVDPNEFDSVYDYLSDFKPSNSVAPVYLACTFSGFGRDMLFSFLCPGETTAKKFVSTYIAKYKGIMDTSTTLMSQSRRLTSRDGWRKLIKPYRYDKGEFEIDDIEVFEEDWFGAC
jgi:hypothetical protein